MCWAGRLALKVKATVVTRLLPASLRSSLGTTTASVALESAKMGAPFASASVACATTQHPLTCELLWLALAGLLSARAHGTPSSRSGLDVASCRWGITPMVCSVQSSSSGFRRISYIVSGPQSRRVPRLVNVVVETDICANAGAYPMCMDCLSYGPAARILHSLERLICGRTLYSRYAKSRSSALGVFSEYAETYVRAQNKYKGVAHN